MKKILLTLLLSLALANSVFSQAAEEKQRLKYEAEMEEKKQEYIKDFTATLKVDEFQKEIIMQTMESYFDEMQKINMMNLRGFERNGLVEKLDITHFADLRAMVTEETMNKVIGAVKGKWNKKEAKKKRKKKRKKDKEN